MYIIPNNIIDYIPLSKNKATIQLEETCNIDIKYFQCQEPGKTQAAAF